MLKFPFQLLLYSFLGKFILALFMWPNHNELMVSASIGFVVWTSVSFIFMRIQLGDKPMQAFIDRDKERLKQELERDRG